MSWTPQQNLAYWEGVLVQAKKGAQAAATAMAKYIAERTAQDTLRRTMHAPGEWYNQKAGEPPAYASGNLAESMFYRSAHDGLRTSAMVGNSADYSRILEFGCVIVPRAKKKLHWADSGGFWYHDFLELPEHPFLSRTTDEAIEDESLREEAIEAFRPYDP